MTLLVLDYKTNQKEKPLSSEFGLFFMKSSEIIHFITVGIILFAAGINFFDILGKEINIDVENK